MDIHSVFNSQTLELLTDAIIDTIKLIPFLYLTYLLMEFIEHKGGEKAERFISASGSFGPAVGSLLGLVPQCGFSAAASGLYAGRIISMGTLIAIFLSTSDEMLPIMISEGAGFKKILPIIVSKLIIGTAAGFVIDLIMRLKHKKSDKDSAKKASDEHHCHDDMDEDTHAHEIHEFCESEHCHCDRNIFVSALIHTLQITLFIFVATLAINIIIYIIGEETVSGWLDSLPVLGEAVAALIGLIPNCASSVIITHLYIEGIIGAGPALAGLLSGSGLGLLVLFRTNKRLRENFLILGILYAVSVASGFLLGLIF